jgi:penicillin-binding protein 1C
VTAEERASALSAAVPETTTRMPRHAPHLARELARDAAPGSGWRPRSTSTSRWRWSAGQRALDTLPERAPSPSWSPSLFPGDPRDGGRRLRGRGAAGMLDLTSRSVPRERAEAFPLRPGLRARIARPDTVLSDNPLRFGSYAPENFDRGFAGRITPPRMRCGSRSTSRLWRCSTVGRCRFAAALKAAGRRPTAAGCRTLPAARAGWCRDDPA